MPRIPMPPTNAEAYKKNTKEQYEALGRFIEAFEAMVNGCLPLSDYATTVADTFQFKDGKWRLVFGNMRPGTLREG